MGEATHLDREIERRVRLLNWEAEGTRGAHRPAWAGGVRDDARLGGPALKYEHHIRVTRAREGVGNWQPARLNDLDAQLPNLLSL